MRPKLSKRVNAQGEQIYSYLCALKEKSRCHSCNVKTANGNMLDRAVIEEIKKLSADDSEFMLQLEKSKKVLAGNREEYDKSIEQFKQALYENDKEIRVLVLSLTKASGTSAESYIMQQINELHNKGEILKKRIEELEGLTDSHALSNIEFDIIRNLLSTFKTTIDDMSVEQKRAAIRTFVKKIVWDGQNVHIYLFGSDDGGNGIDLPPNDFSTDNEDKFLDNSEYPLCEDSKSY